MLNSNNIPSDFRFMAAWAPQGVWHSSLPSSLEPGAALPLQSDPVLPAPLLALPLLLRLPFPAAPLLQPAMQRSYCPPRGRGVWGWGGWDRAALALAPQPLPGSQPRSTSLGQGFRKKKVESSFATH